MLRRTLYGFTGLAAVLLATFQIVAFCNQLHGMQADPWWVKNSIFALLLLTLAAGLICIHHAVHDQASAPDFS